MKPSIPVAERILRRPEVLTRVGVSQSTLYDWMARGEFPRPVALGRALVGWPESVVTAWISACRTRDGRTAMQLRQEAEARLAHIDAQEGDGGAA